MTRTKPRWPVEQWASFGHRCQAVRGRLDALTAALAGVRGLKAADVDRLRGVGRQLFRAMVGAEAVFARQYGDALAIRTIHGSAPSTSRRSPRASPVPSREEWAELGRRVKAIRAELMALARDLRGTAGGTLAFAGRFDRAVAALDRAKAPLDSLVCRQHPDWEEFTHVFYGSAEAVPRPEPAEATPMCADDVTILPGPVSSVAYMLARTEARLAIDAGEGRADTELVCRAAVASALAATTGRSEWVRETAAATARRSVEALIKPRYPGG